MMIETILKLLLISPFVWILLLGVIYFTGIKLKERYLSEAIKYFSLYMTVLAVGLFILTMIRSDTVLLFDYKDWISVGTYRFKTRFVVDLLGATYAFLATALTGIIIRFSRNYLHREAGYFRFILLISALMFGLIIVSFARSLDLLFIGWEIAGTTSVLLIGYFYDKPQPVVHATRAIISYRLCDMGILAASAYAHHYLHTTDFFLIPEQVQHVQGIGATLIGVFIIWASLAKAGQLPMSSWLPASMEGPTPSSAIYYGALSIHLGPFLLLRFYDYFRNYPGFLVAIGVIGGASALYASLVGRTRSDAKTMLGYATISQVGIIYVEIALGFTSFAVFHIVTHASMRTYQFLRSSSLIQDFFENPVVEHNKVIRRTFPLERFFSEEFRKKVYVHALHGFHLDFFTHQFLGLLLFPMKLYIRWEEKWMDYDQKILNKLLRKK